MSLPQDTTPFRAEIDHFIATGWMDYVLARDSWWYTDDDKLKIVRRQNIATAYTLTRNRLHLNLTQGKFLYRALLLSDNFDLNSLRAGLQDFGLFWTCSRECAEQYIPRRCYQTRHPMPAQGFVHVVQIAASPDDIDWTATVGCHLSNPCLEEFRLLPGTLKQAVSAYRSNNSEQGSTLIQATQPVPGIMPIPEGPGFIENFKSLNAFERFYRSTAA